MAVEPKLRIRRDAPPAPAARSRTIVVSDEVHYRLKMLAARCRASVGSVAAAILVEGLDRLGIDGRDGEGGGP